MKAEPVLSYRQQLTDSLFKEVRVWRLPRPLAGSPHPFKYRLALVSHGRCVLRYDNERGKGDHKHVGEQQHPLTFVSMPQLLIDFDHDIHCWRAAHEHTDD